MRSLVARAGLLAVWVVMTAHGSWASAETSATPTPKTTVAQADAQPDTDSQPIHV